MTPRSTDVAVIGGGPAGAAAAIVLARGGARVTAIDDAPRPARTACETLPPAARPLLSDLGVWPDIASGAHRPAFANESAWGSDVVWRTDFTSDPNGHGWHIDRAELDRALRSGACRAGARVWERTRVDAIERRDDRWQLSLRTAQGRSHLRAGWIVDCTGRRGVVASALRVPRLRGDRLVAIVATLALREHDAADPDCLTFVESAPDGWWFTAVTTTGRRTLAYFTDFGEPTARIAATTDGFRALWAAAPHVRARVSPREWRLASAPVVTPAGSSRLASAGGDGWLAAGDALMAFDPISSQGLLTAAYTGLRAAEAMLASPGAPGDVVSRYDAVAERVHAAYLAARRACYAQEQRWRERPFWRTRHGE